MDELIRINYVKWPVGEPRVVCLPAFLFYKMKKGFFLTKYLSMYNI